LAALDDLTRPASPVASVDAAVPFVMPWDLVIVAAAAVAALGGLVRLVLVQRRLVGLLAARGPEADPRILAAAASVARALGCSHSPQLSRSGALAAPIAFGWWRPEICLPDRAVHLADGSLRAMLAHEVTHLRAADPAWMWAGAIVQALFPWQVLFVPVRRQWTRLVELRCDAVAARHSSPTAVAQCLLDVAQWLRPVPPAIVALGMAARPSALRERVEAVLAGAAPGHGHRASSWALGGASLSALTFLAPGVHTRTEVPPAPVEVASESEAPAREAASTPAAPTVAPARDASARRRSAALHAAMAQLVADHDALVHEVARLRAELEPRRQSPTARRALERIAQQLTVLDRLRRRLEAALVGREVPRAR
jgi:hypothetical protein